MNCRASSYFGALFVAAVAQVAAMPIVSAYEAERSEYGAGLRLASFPARVRLLAPVPGSSLSNGGRDALSRAMKMWSGVDGSPLKYEMAGEADAALIEVRPVAEGWKWGAAIGAHTDVTSDARTGEIQHVVIELDATRKWSDAGEVPKDALDLETVLLHELGHAAGLAHSWDSSAVMRAGIKPGQTPRRTLAKDDADGIRALYGSTNSPRQAEQGKQGKPFPRTNADAWAPFRWALAGFALFLFIGLAHRVKTRLGRTGS